jgi:hypothetical protein
MEEFSLFSRKSLTFTEDFSEINHSILLFEVDNQLLEQLTKEKHFRIKSFPSNKDKIKKKLY